MENVKGLNLGLMKVTNKGGIEMNYLIITTLIATNIYSYFMYKKERRLVEWYRWRKAEFDNEIEMD